MTVALVGATSGTNSATTPLPAGIASGDLVFVAVVRNENGQGPTPTGWTKLQFSDYLDTVWSTTALFYREAAGALTTIDLSGWTDGTGAFAAIALRGADPSSVTSASADSNVTPSRPIADGGWYVGFLAARHFSSQTLAFHADLTARSVRSGELQVAGVATRGPVSPAATLGSYTNTLSNEPWAAAVAIAPFPNAAPNAPSLTAPADGATIDRNSTQRFDWDFSDPDAGDSQSKYDLRYRVVGTSTWTDVTGSTPDTFHDFAAGTFAAGNYEWQVRTYDAQGVVGPYSGSAFFTAADPTGVPTIADPTSGSTVSADPAMVSWSTAGGQDAYQLRRVADNAGSPDTTTVYYDTGQVNSTTAWSASVPFETNNRYEHIQVRVLLDGLWSSWASIRVLVSYTPPAAPVVTLSVDNGTGSLWVDITNPTPGSGEPTAAYNAVEVDDGDGWERKATMLQPNYGWRYWTPVSGRDYSGNVRVVTYGDNGTTTTTTVPAGTAPVEGFYYGGGY